MTGLVHDYGLIALFLIVMLESGGVPLPGETALVAAGVFASQGELNIVEVIAVAAAAAIIGDNLGYWAGRTGGRKLLERSKFLSRWMDRVLPWAEGFFHRHGAEDDLHRALLLGSARDRGLDGGGLAHAVVEVPRSGMRPAAFAGPCSSASSPTTSGTRQRTRSRVRPDRRRSAGRARRAGSRRLPLLEEAAAARGEPVVVSRRCSCCPPLSRLRHSRGRRRRRDRCPPSTTWS